MMLSSLSSLLSPSLLAEAENPLNHAVDHAIFMNRETSFTLPIMLVSVRTGNHGAVDWGALQASIVISIVPCLLVYLSLQRYYISGLLSGAVK